MQNDQDINKDELTSTENSAEQPENVENEATQTSKSPSTPEEKSNGSKNLQDELTEAKDKYLRLYSEFENFRRRTAREKLEMIQSANEQLIKTLLPVADDFERAEKSLSDKNDNSKEWEGFLLIYNKFRKVLEQYGVKVMEVASGSGFNPDTQEAITQVPVNDEKLKGKVVDVVEKGYLLNDKVIRFAKVVVGN